MNESQNPNQHPEKEGRSTLSWIILGTIVAIIIAIVLKNSEQQELDLLFLRVDAPLIVWLLLFFGFGFVVAYIIQGQKIRSKNKEIKKLKKTKS